MHVSDGYRVTDAATPCNSLVNEALKVFTCRIRALGWPPVDANEFLHPGLRTLQWTHLLTLHNHLLVSWVVYLAPNGPGFRRSLILHLMLLLLLIDCSFGVVRWRLVLTLNEIRRLINARLQH